MQISIQALKSYPEKICALQKGSSSTAWLVFLLILEKFNSLKNKNQLTFVTWIRMATPVRKKLLWFTRAKNVNKHWIRLIMHLTLNTKLIDNLTKRVNINDLKNNPEILSFAKPLVVLILLHIYQVYQPTSY